MVNSRRKRFQFSLRTLMIFVIAYGGMWALTIRIGGGALAQHYAKQYPHNPVTIAPDGMSIQIGSTGGSDYHVGRVVSPAPFVLLWRWEESVWSDGKWGERGFDWDCHLWLAGGKVSVRETRPYVYDGWMVYE